MRINLFFDILKVFFEMEDVKLCFTLKLSTISNTHDDGVVRIFIQMFITQLRVFLTKLYTCLAI